MECIQWSSQVPDHDEPVFCLWENKGISSQSVSIIVQQDTTIYSFIIFLQTAVCVSDDTLIHHQEHPQTVITTGWTVFATVRFRGGVPTPPRQRTVANTVRPVPHVVITVWMCSWWWMTVSSETRRAVCRNIINCIWSCLVGQLLMLIHDARTHEQKSTIVFRVQ